MALVCPAVKGEILLLQYIVGLVAAGNPVLHLFLDDVIPTHSTVDTDIHDCTSAGYNPITLVSPSWTVGTNAGVTTAVYSEVTFSFGTNASVYGYFVTNQGGDMLWLERFSGATPFDIPDGGGSISITTKLTLS